MEFRQIEMRWEYLIGQLRPHEAQVTFSPTPSLEWVSINEVGDYGWEIVSVFERDYALWVLFKRIYPGHKRAWNER